MHLGLIGFGTIARGLIDILEREGVNLRKVTVLSRQESAATHKVALRDAIGDRAQLVCDVDNFIESCPDLVVECAGHRAVSDCVPDVLRGGIETVMVSVGALADDAVYGDLVAAARSGKTRFVLPAGAIGGIDLLAALHPSGITEVTYTGRKPPSAWYGTAAETTLDLSSVSTEAVFFTGTARDAATRYPKNANVAATLALAGVGWDATKVRLVADPNVSRNIHEYTVTAGGADYSIRIEGHPAPDNPKTSMTTIYSVAREVSNRQREVAI